MAAANTSMAKKLQSLNKTQNSGSGVISQAIGNARNFINNIKTSTPLPATLGSSVNSFAYPNRLTIPGNLGRSPRASDFSNLPKLTMPSNFAANNPNAIIPVNNTTNTGNTGTKGTVNPYETPYKGTIADMLKVIMDAINNKGTYDSSKDEAFQAAQRNIADSSYRDMERRGIADSSITKQMEYQLSMQALPQFAANWENQRQQDLANKMNMLSTLGNLDYNEFNKAISEAGLTGKWNGQATLDAQKFAQDKQNAFTDATGVVFPNADQYNAFTTDTTKEQNDIISKYSKQNGGIQAYINTLDPNSREYVVAQKARNQLIGANPDLAKWGLSNVGMPSLTKQTVDETKKQNVIQNTQKFSEMTGWNISPEDYTILEAAKNNTDLTKYSGNYQAAINTIMKANPNDPRLKPLMLLRDEKIISNGINEKLSYGVKTLDYKKTQSDLRATAADMSMKEQQTIGLRLANELDKKYAGQLKQAELDKLKVDLKTGDLNNAYQRIVNSNADKKIKEEIAGLIANSAATYHDMEYKDASLAVEKNYKEGSLYLEGERLTISKDSAAAKTDADDFKYVNKVATPYRDYIKNNLREDVSQPIKEYDKATKKYKVVGTKKTKVVSKSKVTSYLNNLAKEAAGKGKSKTKDPDLASAVEMLAKEYGVTIKK